MTYDISASRNRYYGGSQFPQQGVIVIVEDKKAGSLRKEGLKWNGRSY